MREFYRKYMLFNIPFHILTAIAAGLLIASFILPPLAVIDNSVIAAVGELFAFGALWCLVLTIEKGGIGRVKRGDTEIELRGKEEEEAE